VIKEYETDSPITPGKTTAKQARKMNSQPTKNYTLAFHPLTPERWADLEKLFGEKGACGGCWCMYWRLTRKEFSQKQGETNRRMLREIVNGGEVPGILAYVDDQPIGWCALAPRHAYIHLSRSRILAPVDEQPVWSVVCFFIAKPHRRQRVSTKLLQSAVDYARTKGARIVEGYPIEPKKESYPDAFAYTGLAGAFRDAGFVEVLRRSPTRPIMRYNIQ
jgi:GNAT superfamily N-acetyltransferase